MTHEVREQAANKEDEGKEGPQDRVLSLKSLLHPIDGQKKRPRPSDEHQGFSVQCSSSPSF
jgi:hypothetical protein